MIRASIYIVIRAYELISMYRAFFIFGPNILFVYLYV